MHVTVRLFASLRERAGAAELALELPDGARVADALARVDGLTDGLSVVMAVNREYADPEQRLAPGDELALIPPVSGGAGEPAAVHVRIAAEPLALDPLLARVRDDSAGAIVSFAGVTREVPALEYEAYAEMAQAEITAVAVAARERHGLCAVAVEHRTGTVALGEPSVLIAVSAPHRAQAFAGAREVIDEIKRRAPIWKQEEGAWVSGSPAPAPPASPPAPTHAHALARAPTHAHALDREDR
jgi:molybdopterin converting factor subunit 1